MRLLFSSGWLLAGCAAVCCAQQPAPDTRPRILLVSNAETHISKDSNGLAGGKGGLFGGAASSNATITEHSEIWEAARRFLDECPEVAVTTDASAPFDYAVRLDYEKYGTLMGQIALYQVVVLNPRQEPLYIHKKDYLRREIKPACKAIMANWASSHQR